MKIQSLALTIGIVINGFISTGALTSAQAVTLTNGDFNTNSLGSNQTLVGHAAWDGIFANKGSGSGYTPAPGATGNSVLIQNGTTEVPGWTFGMTSPTSGVSAINYLVSTGYAAYDNMNIQNGRPAFYQTLYGTTPIASPNGTANYFIVADADSRYHSNITTTVNGLIQGHTYDVSFYQAAGQQGTTSGATTEWWQVSLGGAPAKISATMAPTNTTSGSGQIHAAEVTPWQLQTMSFTYNGISSSAVLDFLAQGTPNNVEAPPMSLLAGVSINDTTAAAVPEPLEVVGSIVGFGACLVMRSKYKHKK